MRSATTAVAADSSSSSEEEEIVESDRETESSSGDVAQASPVSTTPGPSQTRKRMRRSVTWEKNVRRRRKNAGLRYTSDTTNAVVSIILYSAHVYALVNIRAYISVFCFVYQQVTPKRPSRTSCGCSRRCFDRLSESCRTANFDLQNGQNAYLCGCVKVLPTKSKYTKAEESRRHFSRVFYVQNGSVSERVCKTACGVYSKVPGHCSAEAGLQRSMNTHPPPPQSSS